MKVRHTMAIRPIAHSCRDRTAYDDNSAKVIRIDEVTTTIRPTTDRPNCSVAKMAPEFTTIRSTRFKPPQNLYSHNSAKNTTTIRTVTPNYRVSTGPQWLAFIMPATLARKGQTTLTPITILCAANESLFHNRPTSSIPHSAALDCPLRLGQCCKVDSRETSFGR
jgi:hypothetical protein